MPGRLIKKAWSFLPKGSMNLVLLSGASYVAGLFRDRILAHTFGASRMLDAYGAAFLLPDFLFNLLVASGIAAAVVPIVHELLQKNEKEVSSYMSTVLTLAVTVMGAVSILFLLFANWLVVLVAPGFSHEDQLVVASMMRLLAFSPILFAASNALGALSVARQRYVWYGISPIVYNLGIIFGALVFAPTMGIRGVVYGTLIGATLHLLVRVFDLIHSGIHLTVSYRVRTREFFDTLKLMGPKMVGHPVDLATFWGFTAIASGLQTGSIVVLNFSRNFQSVGVSLIGIALATSSFALFAREAARGDMPAFKKHLSRACIAVSVLSVIAAVALYIIRAPLIALLIGGKAFGPNEIMRTAELLGVMAFSIPTESLSHVLARAWYSTKNTWVPVSMSVVALCVSVGGAWLMVGSLGIVAIGWAFVAGSVLKTLGLALFLPMRIVRLSRQ